MDFGASEGYWKERMLNGTLENKENNVGGKERIKRILTKVLISSMGNSLTVLNAFERGSPVLCI